MLMANRIDPKLEAEALSLAQSEWGGEVKRRKLYSIKGLSALCLPSEPDMTLNRRSYLLQVCSQQESRVVDALRDAGLDAYCPKEPKSEKVNATKRRIIERPMISGYVFPIFDIHRDNWRIIRPERDGRGMKGVIRLFMVMEWPLPIPDAAMDQVRHHETIATMRGKGKNWRNIPFKIDDFVQIDDYGPWQGFIGQVLEVLARSERIRIGIDVFGRQTPVEVSVNQVRAV